MGAAAIPLLVASTATQVMAAKKAKRAAEVQGRFQRAVQESEQKRASLKAARERAQQVRRARIARASQAAQGQQGAGTGGSGLLGATQGVTSQTAQNISFLSKNQQISSAISDLNIKAGKHATKSQSDIAMTETVGNIFGTAAGFAQGED